jgi:hypothetical protein
MTLQVCLELCRAVASVAELPVDIRRRDANRLRILSSQHRDGKPTMRLAHIENPLQTRTSPQMMSHVARLKLNFFDPSIEVDKRLTSTAIEWQANLARVLAQQGIVGPFVVGNTLCVVCSKSGVPVRIAHTAVVDKDTRLTWQFPASGVEVPVGYHIHCGQPTWGPIGELLCVGNLESPYGFPLYSPSHAWVIPPVSLPVPTKPFQMEPTWTDEELYRLFESTAVSE